MSIVFFPGVLLFEPREPAEGERGKLIRSSTCRVVYLPLKQLFLPLFVQITEMHSELEKGQTMASPLQLASMLVDWMDPEKTVYAPSPYVSDDPFTFLPEMCRAARRTTAFTSILPLISSKLSLMTGLHVREIINFQCSFIPDIISHTKARARKFCASC